MFKVLACGRCGWLSVAGIGWLTACFFIGSGSRQSPCWAGARAVAARPTREQIQTARGRWGSRVAAVGDAQVSATMRRSSCAKCSGASSMGMCPVCRIVARSNGRGKRFRSSSGAMRSNAPLIAYSGGIPVGMACSQPVMCPRARAVGSTPGAPAPPRSPGAARGDETPPRPPAQRPPDEHPDAST